MSYSANDIAESISAVSRIPVVASILEVICKTTGMGFAAIARVTPEKWVACSVRDEIDFGLKPGGELLLETTICNEVRQSHEPVVINHVAEDAIFCNHPAPKMYGFQSYISVPIFLKDNSFFGTLCAIDPRPANLNTPETIGMFKLFADLISFHLNALKQLNTSETNLKQERKTAQVREEFIAILGHDLRTPVTAILSSAQVLQRMPPGSDLARLTGIITNSAKRMNVLISDMLDFARGRLGGGISLTYKQDEAIETILNQVIAELTVIATGKNVHTHFDLQQPVSCDAGRIAQLFSNLLRNAITYGSVDEPIKVKAESMEGTFTLSVTNKGNQIPADTMMRLFQPFSRGDDNAGKQGLGLGLYIASEIAEAHSGKLTVISAPGETTFTLIMPNNQPA